MAVDLDMRRRRASYRACHRGTKEVDLLLGRFAQARLAGMSEADLGVFERLLEEPDPRLQGWIMDGTQQVDDAFAGLILDIRMFHKLAPGGIGSSR